MARHNGTTVWLMIVLSVMELERSLVATMAVLLHSGRPSQCAFPFPQPIAVVSTCVHIRYAYIRLENAEWKLEELSANIFHQPHARMNKLM